MNKNIPYELIRSSRKTLAIQISADGSVTVRAPMRCRKADVEAFVREKSGWIVRTQEELGRRVREREEKKEQLPKWSREDYERHQRLAVQVLGQRTAYYAQKMGIIYGKITIRDQKTRWGSCSAKGTLSFNWRLMLAPPAILDYVVVHELCHLTHMDHSAAFWQAVESVYPDYRSARQWLKEHGQELIL